MRRLLTTMFLLLVLLVAGCGGDDDETTADSATATATATATPAETATETPTPEDTGGEQGTGCKPTDKPAPKSAKLAKPSEKLDPAKTYIATVKTNCGTFEITLDAKQAPKTGGSFKYLADKGFYDGLSFHRVVGGFVIQGGDPKGDGTGGPGYSVVEAPPDGVVYKKGTVAMAKTQLEDAGTSGSQFFVVTSDQASSALTPDYALVGQVTKGMDVVDLIGTAPVSSDEQPISPIVMESVKVTER